MNIRLKQEEKIKILCADDLYGIMQRILMREGRIDRNREHFWTVSLDNAKRLLAIELVSMGSINQTLVEPMEVLSLPLQKRAVNIILVHNHPSGELRPSTADKDITDRLIQAALLMKVPVLDHLIISEKSFYSFLDSGLLHELEKSLKYVPTYLLKQRIEKEATLKGSEQGKMEMRKEIARQMRKEGYDMEAIAKITGLTKASISKLK